MRAPWRAQLCIRRLRQRGSREPVGSVHDWLLPKQRNWKPGRYTIGASLNLSPYYKPVFDKIDLRVVK